MMHAKAWLIVIGLVHGCGGESGSPDDDVAGTFPTGAGAATGAGGSGAAMASTGLAAGGGTAAGGASSVGSAAGGSGVPCSDQIISEPNESLAAAWKMTEDKVDDCASDSDPIRESGTIAGANDVDWFWYEGADGFGPCIDPGRSLVQSGTGLRICKFLECLVGNETFDCPAGTSVAQEDGRDGCCGTQDFDLADLDCSGTLDDAANVYIRIDQPGATADTCNAYTLSVDY